MTVLREYVSNRGVAMSSESRDMRRLLAVGGCWCLQLMGSWVIEGGHVFGGFGLVQSIWVVIMHYQGHYLEIFGASMGLAWMCCPYPSGASWGPDLFLHTKLPSSINHGPAMLNFEIMCVSPWVSFGSSPIYSSDEPFWCNLSPLMIDWGPSSGSGIGADCSQLVGSEPRFPKVGQHQSTSKCNESVTFLVCSPPFGDWFRPKPIWMGPNWADSAFHQAAHLCFYGRASDDHPGGCCLGVQRRILAQRLSKILACYSVQPWVCFAELFGLFPCFSCDMIHGWHHPHFTFHPSGTLRRHEQIT
jgi:hypothetical protein